MRLTPWIQAVTLGAFFLCNLQGQSAGLTQRVANTTLQMPASPPRFGYTLSNAFPGLSLTEPVGIVSPPGETNRLFILEKGGNIVVITNLANPNRTVFMSLAAGLAREKLIEPAAVPDDLLGNTFALIYAGHVARAHQCSGSGRNRGSR